MFFVVKYFILSATQSDQCPISLVEDAILYGNIEQINSNIDCGMLPWYSYKTSKKCDLPLDAFLLLKRKGIQINIRNINENIYVVSDSFKKILEKYLKVEFILINLIDENLKKYNDKKYYIFRFEELLDYKSIIDLKKSKFHLENDFLILEKLVFLDSINNNIFKLKDIDSAQDTIFISESLKNELEAIEHTGVIFFSTNIAKWRHSDDFNFMFMNENEINSLIWPV